MLEGEIELSFTIDEHKFSRYFSNGFYFGDYNIISQKPSEFNYIVKTNSKCFCFPKTKFLKILNKYPNIKDIFYDNSFQNYKEINLTLVKHVKTELMAYKGINLSLKETLTLFKKNIVLTPFNSRNKEISELRKILNVFECEERSSKIPKENLRQELYNIKGALEELIEIDKDWLRY